jgi:hypothetical protein
LGRGHAGYLPEDGIEDGLGVETGFTGNGEENREYQDAKELIGYGILFPYKKRMTSMKRSYIPATRLFIFTTSSISMND